MKRSILIVFLLPSLGFAQIDYRKGYVVSLTGDTLGGLIAFRSKAKRNTYCLYKCCRESDPVKYLPKDVKEYGYESGGSYALATDKFEKKITKGVDPEKTKVCFYGLLGVSGMNLKMQGKSGNKYRLDQYLYGPSLTVGLSFFSFYDKLEFITEIKFNWAKLDEVNTYTVLINGFDPAYVTREDVISLPSISLPFGFKYNIVNPRATPTIGGGIFLTKFINPEITMNGSTVWPSNQSNFDMQYEFDTKQLPNSGMWFSVGYLLSKSPGNRISVDLRFEQCFPVGQVEKMNSYVLQVGWHF